MFNKIVEKAVKSLKHCVLKQMKCIMVTEGYSSVVTEKIKCCLCKHKMYSLC
jgi:hypothetical protein